LRRLSDLACQQSDKAAAEELTKANPPGASREQESRGVVENGLTKGNCGSELGSKSASLRRADAGFVKRHAAVLGPRRLE
jgi:hypothetical protein